MPDGRFDQYYRVLGVDASASPEKIKGAHRDLVQVWHPDRFTANPRLQKLAAEKLLEINHAYDALRFKAPQPRSAPPVTHPPRSVRKVREFRKLREWSSLGIRTAGVAAAVFAFIMAGRGFHALLNYKPGPVPSAAVLQEPDEPQSPRPARHVRGKSTDALVANGAEIIGPRGRAGVGRLTVTNQTDEDAVAALLDHATGSTVRMVYICAGMQTNIDSIGPGIYRLSLDSGSAWSWGTRQFTRNRTIPRAIGPFTFTQVQTAGQLRGDQYSVLLRHDTTDGSEMSHAGM